MIVKMWMTRWVGCVLLMAELRNVMQVGVVIIIIVVLLYSYYCYYICYHLYAGYLQLYT